MPVKQLVRSALRRCGVDVVRYRRPDPDAGLPADASPADREILRRIAPYTMTGVARQLGLVQAVRHLVRQGVPGCFVECGVWRGGSSMAVALALLQEGEGERPLFLYDTFEGMTTPTELDRMPDGTTARTRMDADPERRSQVWAVAGLDEVRQNMRATGYVADRVHCVRGPVEHTLPRHAPPGPIALLRLDTDWYASTRHELEHLFPLLQPGGILVIDDYGDWQGARQAVDEYFAACRLPYFMHRIDETGRLVVKR